MPDADAPPPRLADLRGLVLGTPLPAVAAPVQKELAAPLAPPAAAAAGAALSFEMIEGAAALHRLEPEWQSLFERSAGARFFQSPAWWSSFVAAVDDEPDRWVAAVVREGGRLAALLPLRRLTHVEFGLPIRCLSLLTHNHANLSDGLAPMTADGARLMAFALREIARQPRVGWDELCMPRLPARTALATALRSGICGRRAIVREQRLSRYLDCSGSFDQATAAVSGNFKRNLRRLARRAEETAPLRFLSLTDPAEVQAALPRFLRLEASGWKGAGGTHSAIECCERLTALYHDLARNYGALGQVRLNLLQHGDEDVAAQFCVRVGGTLSILKIAFSEKHSSFAPGNLLMERTIRDCCADPAIHEMSFVTDPPWAHLWKPAAEEVTYFSVYAATPRGVAA